MRRQLGYLEPALGQNAFYLVTVGLALGGFGEVEQASIPAGDLDAFEAEPRGPAGDGLEIVEWRRIARELRQEYGRAFDRPHRAPSLVQEDLNPPLRAPTAHTLPSRAAPPLTNPSPHP